MLSLEYWRDSLPHLPTNTEQTNVPITVGFSVVLAMFSVCICVFAHIDSTHLGPYLVVFTIDNFSTVLGFAASIYLLRALRTAEQRHVSQYDPSFRLKIIFLWIFGIGVMLQEGTYLVIDAICLGKGENFYGIVIVARSFNMVFMILQMTLITFSKTKMFKSTWVINLCILFIIISNLCIWLKGTVKDVSNIYRSIGWLPVLNNTNQSFPQHGPYCFWYSPIQSVLPTITQCTIPMQFEFQLLATIFLLNIKCNRNILHVNRSGIDNFSDEFIPASMLNTRRIGNNKYSAASGTICVVILFPLTIVHFLSRYALSDEALQTSMLKYTYMTNAGLAAISTFLYVYGFHIFSHFKYDKRIDKTIGFNEYSMVFTMTSEVIFYTLVLLAVAHKQLNQIFETSWQCFVMVIQICYQTLFLIMIGQRHKFASISDVNKARLRSVLVCGGIFNIYLWFTNTFFDMRSTKEFYEIGDLISENIWRVTKRVIFPFTIFYRFHTCMEFYSLYQEL